MVKTTLLITLILTLLTSIGCNSEENSRVADLATQQMERQADQNRRMSDLQQEVASGSRELVEADAKARQEMVTLQRQIQSERSEIGYQRDHCSCDHQSGLCSHQPAAAFDLLAVTAAEG